jgi:hypothetical protein
MTLVDQHPRVQAADHALADLAKRRADFEARVRPIAEEDAKAERVYNQALEDALLRGGPMPAPLVRQLPELADVEVRHRFLFEQQQLNEERQRAVAAAFPDVLEQARAMATELAVAAQAPLQQLLTAMGEVGTLLQAVRVCRDAANAEARDRNDGTGRTQFNDFPLTVERIIQVIATAGDPIDLIDLGGRREIRGLNTGMTVGDVRQLLGTRA